MCFVEYKEINLVNGDERMQETVVKYLGSENYGHIIFEMLIPDRLGPQINVHIPTKTINLVVHITLQDSKLLEHQCNAIDLFLCQHSTTIDGHRKLDNEEGKTTRLSLCPILKLLVKYVSQQ